MISNLASDANMWHCLFAKEKKCLGQGQGWNPSSLEYVINSHHDDSYMIALKGSRPGCTHRCVFAADP